MKNGIFSIALLSLISMNAFAADGEITFEGSIVDTACTVDIGTGNKMTVTLGEISKTSFTGVGSTSSATEFNIKLKACPAAITSATVKFDGNAYSGDPSTLALDGGETGVATGVGIQIKDSTETVVPLATPSSSYTLQETEENTLPFYASYIQKAATVVAGTANATAQFTVNYN